MYNAKRKMENTSIITKGYVHTVIKKRERDIHKGDCGKVLAVAGSKGMAGAAVLCGRGAYRAGSGLVRIAICEELFPIVQIGLPEATCVSRDAFLGAHSQYDEYDAVAIGPGLGDDKKNEDIIRNVLREYRGTLVIDADGLNTIARAEMASEVRKAEADIIITPHAGEASRLLGLSMDKLKSIGRTETALMLAEKFSAVSLLKGAGTVVATPGGEAYINSTGNPGMATGGSGDVLTGVIASLAGQGLRADNAAKAGVFLHGLAADIAAEKMSQHALMAGDIADHIGCAVKMIIKV
mgnify:CR=1 FL=1